MKKIYFLAFFCFALSFSFSQDTIDGQWFLSYFNHDDTEYYPYNTPYNTSVDINFYYSIYPPYNLNADGDIICNGYVIEFSDVDDESFVVDSVGITLADCGPTNGLFEYYYTTVLGGGFYNNTPTNMNYIITGTGSNASLLITNQSSGDFAVYNRDNLSIEKYAKTTFLELVKNPVSNLVKLQSDFEIENFGIYNLYTLEGKLVLSSILKYQIDVAYLNKGIYFLEVKLNNGKQQTIRFIKE